MEDINMSSTAGRSKMYKSNGRDQEELRRKRREDEVQIRKSRREEMFDKHRRISAEHQISDITTPAIMRTVVEGLQSMEHEIIQATVAQVLQHVLSKTWTISYLSKIQTISKISDVYCNRAIDSSTRILIGDFFSEVSGLPEANGIQLSTDDICMKSLVAILSAHNVQQEEVLCDALQAINCFIGRSIAYRNLALDHAIVPELLELSSQNPNENMCRSIMYIVSVLCDKVIQCSPEVEEVAPLLQIVASGICSTDSMIQNDAATACVHLAEWPQINEYMRIYELCGLLVTNLCNDNGNARPTVQWAISSIIQTTTYFTQEMIAAGLLEKLKGFVNVSYMSQDVCFLISNICAEGTETVDKVISSEILREVFRVMDSAEYRCRKEAAFAVCHCCASENPAHLEYLRNSGMLGSFIDLLTCMDATLVLLILEAIDSLLHYGQNYLAGDSINPLTEKLEELGCREKLVFLTDSQCVNIHVKAYEILDMYFNDDEVENAEFPGLQHMESIENTIEHVLNQAIEFR